MNLPVGLLFAALLTVAGCHDGRKINTDRFVMMTAEREEPLPLPEAPSGTYPEYCVFYPEIASTPTEPRRQKKARVAILGVRASVRGGWTTATEVDLTEVLSPSHHSMSVDKPLKYSRCTLEDHFKQGDTLKIDSVSNGLALTMKRGGTFYGPYPLSVGGTADNGADPPVLWYKTTDDHYGYRYYIYMVNAPLSPTVYKQRYWIEAFRVGGLGSNNEQVPSENQDCLDEQPVLTTTHVEARRLIECPYISGQQENGIGVGDEPK